MHLPGMNSADRLIFFLTQMKTVWVLTISPSYNRYPDPHQVKIKERLSQIKGLPPANIFLGNGSDECIELLYRAFCNPGKDNVIIHPPTYGMYEVSAHIHDVEVRRAPLSENFQLDLDVMMKRV